MTYLTRKLNEIRSLFEEHNPTDDELIAFMQELVATGYGDSSEAMSIYDGLSALLDEEDFAKNA